MDVPKPAVLKQITLHPTTDGSTPGILARDDATGRIMRVPASLAAAISRMRATVLGRPGTQPGLSQEQARGLAGFLMAIEFARRSDRGGRKPFNPLFMMIPLFDVGPYQAPLRSAADRLVSGTTLGVFLVLCLICMALGVSSEWAVLAAFEGVFSLEAIVTFGLIAPFLKLVHEMGHVLVATRFGIRVARAGIMLIGLYPMPYVDCSDADVSANRNQRIMLSLAGIATDLLMGMVAFILWHFATDAFSRALFGNVVVFLTLNSVLFNANPLIRLDGYYALVDLAGRRNFATRALQVVRGLEAYLSSFGARGALPSGHGEIGMLAYGVAALAYRVYILFVITLALVPQYLGLGVALVAWGGTVLFLTPLMRHRGAAQPPRPRSIAAWGRRAVLLGALVALAFLLRWPVQVLVPVLPDAEGTYSVTAGTDGQILSTARAGRVETGDILVETETFSLDEAVSLARKEFETAERLLEAVRGDDARMTRMAGEKLQELATRLAVLDSQVAKRRVTAHTSGLFVPAANAYPGSYLAAGATAGHLFPDAGVTVMTGSFPERYVSFLETETMRVEVRHGQRYLDVDPSGVSLRDGFRIDPDAPGSRFVLEMPVAVPPDEMVGQPSQARLTFGSATLVEHFLFWVEGLGIQFREARIANTEHLLD